jgi:protein phosphatase PTC1
MIIRFDKEAVMEKQVNKESAIGVEGDVSIGAGKVSEVEKIIGQTKQKIAEGDVPAVGVSASNSGRGHDPVIIEDGETHFTPTIIEGSVEEEPSSIEELPDVNTGESSSKTVAASNDSFRRPPQPSAHAE